MAAWYNEIDPKAAAWLRELIKGGHIADGVVDERSIEDIKPGELAGWPDSRALWTGSCPCQPFSAAGERKGFDDERHLWPAWFHLIRECKPQRVFGEQVASAMQWVDLVQGDLEAEGYACGYAVLGAHSVGAPHIRQRLYWLADSGSERRQQIAGSAPGDEGADGRRAQGNHLTPGDGPAGKLADALGERGRGGEPRIEDAGHAWEPSQTVLCRDNRCRHIEPGTFPLAHGVPSRVGLLRGYGNAIVPQVAEAFIRACE